MIVVLLTPYCFIRAAIDGILYPTSLFRISCFRFSKNLKMSNDSWKIKFNFSQHRSYLFKILGIPLKMDFPCNAVITHPTDFFAPLPIPDCVCCIEADQHFGKSYKHEKQLQFPPLHANCFKNLLFTHFCILHKLYYSQVWYIWETLIFYYQCT